MRPARLLLALVTLAGLLVAGLLVLGPRREVEPEGAPGPSGTIAEREPAGGPDASPLETGAPSAPVAASEPDDLSPAALRDAAGRPAAEGPRIRGRVVGGSATLLAGLEVLATPEDRDAPPRSASCEPDGTFALRGLEPGARYRLRAVPAGKAAFARPRTNTVEVLAGAEDVELRLLPTSAVAFQVVDGRTGESLSTFEVRIGARFGRPLLDGQGRVRQSFPEGRVRCEDLLEPAAGEALTIVVSARGYQELRLADVFVPEGGELELGRVRLERAPHLLVQVLDEETRAPIAGALVRLRLNAAAATETELDPRGFDPWQGRTDDQGRVQLASQPGMEAVLSVRHATHAALDRPLFLPLTEEHLETVLLSPAR